MIASGAAYNLDDEVMRERLQTLGILVHLNKDAMFYAEENGSTGFTWMIDEAACDDEIFSFSTTLSNSLSSTSSQDATVARTRMVGAPSRRYFTLTANGTGSCQFRLFYARPWEFSFEDEAGSAYIKKIEIPVTAIE